MVSFLGDGSSSLLVGRRQTTQCCILRQSKCQAVLCQSRVDPPVPRPSGSSASPGFSSSTMGSECSLRMSLPRIHTGD